MAADDTVVRNNDELEQHFGEKKDTPTEQSEKFEVNRNSKDSTFGKLYSEDSAKDSNADSGLNLKTDTDFSNLVFDVTFASLQYTITPAAFDKKIDDFKARTAHLRKHDPEYYDAIIKDFNLLSEAIKKKLERIKLHNERFKTMFESLKVTTPPLNVAQPEPIEIGFEVVVTPKTLLKTILVGAAVLGVYYLGKRRR